MIIKVELGNANVYIQDDKQEQNKVKNAGVESVNQEDCSLNRRLFIFKFYVMIHY